mgnify:CR=1 FL=1
MKRKRGRRSSWWTFSGLLVKLIVFSKRLLLLLTGSLLCFWARLGFPIGSTAGASCPTSLCRAADFMSELRCFWRRTELPNSKTTTTTSSKANTTSTASKANTTTSTLSKARTATTPVNFRERSRQSTVQTTSSTLCESRLVFSSSNLR